MRRIHASLLLALTACGPAVGPATRASGNAPAQVIVTGDGIHLSTSSETRTVAIPVAAPVDRVWQALPDVFREMELEARADAATRSMVTGALTFNRRLFGEPARTFFDCGRGQFGTEVATTHTIHLNLRSTVQPGTDAGSSRLETVVQAYARSNDGANAVMAQCRTQGRLEAAIAARVRQKLGA